MRGEPAKRFAWPDGHLASPETGRPLRLAGTFLEDETGRERWPVVEGIPYLRTGRDGLRQETNERLDAGDAPGALVGLLRDQDDWAPDPPPAREAVAEAVEAADGGRPAREVMRALGFGAVADYFAYRLSDPTYLAGLALLRSHWNAPRASFELACGIGHYTRELARRGVEAAAGDVVFAKLWLARRYLVPAAPLVCFDASRRFPLPDASVDLALCQDAFYFLPDKPHVAAELSRISGPRGTVLVGHSHNAATENLSPGDPATAAEHATLFPGASLYDDGELTAAALSGERPPARRPRELARSAAVGLARPGPGAPAPAPAPDLLIPPPGTPLHPNPLYRRETDGASVMRLEWPSERYREEYGPLSGYLPERLDLDGSLLRRAATEGVGASPEIDRLARLRVLVDGSGGP